MDWKTKLDSQRELLDMEDTKLEKKIVRGMKVSGCAILVIWFFSIVIIFGFVGWVIVMLLKHFGII